LVGVVGFSPNYVMLRCALSTTKDGQITLPKHVGENARFQASA
jgi:hypothetical protein